jgi:DEAD/DEAH box helicase domain-containing protein
MDLPLASEDFPLPLSRSPRRSVEAVVSAFQAAHGHPNSPVRAVYHQPACEAIFAEMPLQIRPDLRTALAARGVERLYIHQAQAFAHLLAGGNVAVVTPTASGKTLCYNLPVLNRLLEEPDARAVYLFPTKALAEDQLHEFQAVVDGLGDAAPGAFTYDGDTPQDARKAIRQRAHVVLTNPDMLHSGILPHHTRWARFFEALRYVVIDELHYYRGVYGSHVANVLRRLRRIAEFYGSTPQFICCSATIANPRELAEALTGERFELVERNGAPRGERYFVLYNPPVVNRQLGIRRSYIQESRRVAQKFLDHDLQTLVFANNRLATEVLVKYLKDASETPMRPPEAVRGYRGGYLPRERREIERLLRAGAIRAVVATNALELGIDIGSLDAVVMAAYPGSIASSWQRAGRAGRRQGVSAAVLVASSAPVDQYIVEHPNYFFGRSPEHAAINPENLEILLAHLKCAAFELPIRDGERFGPHDPAELCRYLEETGFLHHAGSAWHWTTDSYPADATSLRSVSSDNFVVVDITAEPRAIAEVSFSAAMGTLHEKAIYLHEARQYHVERFDYAERKAYVRRVECDYYTEAIDYTQVKALVEAESKPVGGGLGIGAGGWGKERPFGPGFLQDDDRREAPDIPPALSPYPQPLVSHGDVRINRQIVGFKKIKFYTMENVGAGNLSMPEQEMQTTAFWLHFPPPFLARLSEYTAVERRAGINGLANALRTVAALAVMCDPRDLGIGMSEEPNLYLYDAYPGGIGQSAPLYRLAPELLVRSVELIAACPCETGCPSCVGPEAEIGDRGKEVAAAILKLVAES